MKKRIFIIILEVEDREAPEHSSTEASLAMTSYLKDVMQDLVMDIKKIEVKCEDAQQ